MCMAPFFCDFVESVRLGAEAHVRDEKISAILKEAITRYKEELIPSLVSIGEVSEKPLLLQTRLDERFDFLNKLHYFRLNGNTFEALVNFECYDSFEDELDCYSYCDILSDPIGELTEELNAHLDRKDFFDRDYTNILKVGTSYLLPVRLAREDFTARADLSYMDAWKGIERLCRVEDI